MNEIDRLNKLSKKIFISTLILMMILMYLALPEIKLKDYYCKSMGYDGYESFVSSCYVNTETFKTFNYTRLPSTEYMEQKLNE